MRRAKQASQKNSMSLPEISVDQFMIHFPIFWCSKDGSLVPNESACLTTLSGLAALKFEMPENYQHYTYDITIHLHSTSKIPGIWKSHLNADSLGPIPKDSDSVGLKLEPRDLYF